VTHSSPEVLFQDLRHDEIRGWWWWWWSICLLCIIVIAYDYLSLLMWHFSTFWLTFLENWSYVNENFTRDVSMDDAVPMYYTLPTFDWLTDSLVCDAVVKPAWRGRVGCTSRIHRADRRAADRLDHPVTSRWVEAALHIGNVHTHVQQLHYCWWSQSHC